MLNHWSSKMYFNKYQSCMYYIPLSVWLSLWMLEFLETVAMSDASSITCILEDIEWFRKVWLGVSSIIKNQKAQSTIINNWKSNDPITPPLPSSICCLKCLTTMTCKYLTQATYWTPYQLMIFHMQKLHIFFVNIVLWTSKSLTNHWPRCLRGQPFWTLLAENGFGRRNMISAEYSFYIHVWIIWTQFFNSWNIVLSFHFIQILYRKIVLIDNA